MPGLTSADLNALSYTGVNLEPNKTTSVTVNIKYNDVAGDAATLPIKVKMLSRDDTSTKIVNNIKSKVTTANPIKVDYNYDFGQ